MATESQHNSSYKQGRITEQSKRESYNIAKLARTASDACLESKHIDKIKKTRRIKVAKFWSYSAHIGYVKANRHIVEHAGNDYQERCKKKDKIKRGKYDFER